MTIRSFVAGSALAQAFKPRPRAALSTELFAGVEKPMITLCHMLVADMLQNLDVPINVTYPAPTKGSGRRSVIRERVFPKFTRRVEEVSWDHHHSNTNYITYIVGGETLSLEVNEKKILEDGFEKFKELQQKKQKADEEGKRQQKAVDLIASFFETKEESADAQ